MTLPLADRLVDIIQAYNRKDLALTPSTSFVRDMELDSLTVMDMVAAIEDHFDITLPLNRLPDLETIADLTAEVRVILASLGRGEAADA